jgi:Uma2 family endonuclease
MSNSGTSTREWTVADLLARFGAIPHRRIRHDPPPGSATEDDVLEIQEREKRLYELVDGVLVEKTVGVQESFLALILGSLLREFVDRHQMGFVLGADGTARLFPGRVRIPDLSFISWDRFPNRQVPRLSMVDFCPDLVVEVLSPGNTQEEMDEKLKNYFGSGARLVWYVDPARRIVQVYTAVDAARDLREGDTLDGGTVLPGFSVPLTDLYASLEQ